MTGPRTEPSGRGTPAQTPPAGWYPDPEDAAERRYWNGTVWTEHRAPGECAAKDPATNGRTEGGSAPPPQRRVDRGLGGWLRRHPWATLAIASLASLVVGIGIGAAGGQPELDDARRDLAEARGELEDVRAATRRREGELAQARERIAKLSARGEVPDFVGQSIDEAETAEQVELYGWRVKARRAISDAAEPGTVIRQSPREGATLAAGRSITLTVARKPPPKPKQWVTIRTLSGSGGASKSDQFRVPSGSVRILYNMPGEGNNAITLYRAPNEYVDLLVNDIGPTSGKTRVYEPGTYYLDVMGDSWTVQVQVFRRPT